MSTPMTTGVPGHLRPRAYCCELIANSGRSVSLHRCLRAAVVTREGAAYCKQHDPVAVQKRREESAARWHEKQRPVERRHRRLQDYHKLIAALRKIAVAKPQPLDLAEARELLRRIDIYEEDGK